MPELAEMRQQVKKGQKMQIWLAVLAAVLLAASLVAGFNHSPLFFLGTLAALPAAGAAVWLYFRLKRLKALLKIRERWHNKVPNERDFQVIAKLFRHMQTDAADPAAVDDQTWSDLDMDQVYALMDRTFTAEGQAVLYRILRSPCLTPVPLQDRAAVIKLFQDDVPFREKVQLILLGLEGRSEKDSTDLLWGNLPLPSPAAPLYHLLALAALLSLLSSLIIGPQGIALIMGMFSLNIYIHHRVSRRIAHRLPAVSSLAALLRTAHKLSRLESRPVLKERQAKLGQAASACRPILNKTRLLRPKTSFSDLDLIYEYVKYFFLLEVRSFYSALGAIHRQIENLRQIYLVTGELDALQAVASFRESRPGYCEPDLSAGNKPSFTVTGVRHPLLEEPVDNSIAMERQGVLITGSNMSGKSTFLRTIGLNALLAQTIYTCPAVSYKGCFFRVVTSISSEDSLTEGKSYYFREAERLLTLIRAAETNTGAPALCIVDELLSGTNYTERLAASEAILNYLSSLNALIIVATHDLDLAEKLQGLYRCCHFTDQVSPEGLHFDFKLKEGLASTRNAIKLLAYLGYPREILEQANLLAELPREGKSDRV